MIKIALDVMGGDNAPVSTINGAITFLNNNDDSVKIYLVGPKEVIKAQLSNFSDIDDKFIEIVDASQKIEVEDSPSRIFKTKPDSSMNKAINLLKTNIVNAVVSAGHTGCLLSTSFFNLCTIAGVKRPALFAIIPSEKGDFLICDVGANSSAKPEHLIQFSKMSSIYMKYQLGIKKPKIGLVNIGLESNKGNELTKKTFKLMNKESDNFIGNIESRYIFDGLADIIVCDGFTGNIILKLIEGMMKYNLDLISNKLDLNDSPTINHIRELYNYEKYGAAPILGIKGLVFKSHGSSSQVSILNALKAAKKAYLIDLQNKFTELN